MAEFFARLREGGALEVASGPGLEGVRTVAGCHVLFRGVLANAQALCRQLVVAAGATDACGVVAHAYRAWSGRLQANLHGEFSALVQDAASGDTLITHDALGISPLFFAVRGQELHVATCLEYLVDSRSAADLDEEFVADFLVRGLVTGARTPYRAIRRLMPGQSLRWQDGRASVFCGWDLADIPQVRLASDDAYEERFRELLEDGVRAALDGATTPWVALSGGLDSSTIACVAARQQGRGLDAYSVLAPRWPEANEERWMRAVVDQCGMRWHPVDVEAALPFTRLPSTFFAEPSQSVINLELLGLQNRMLSQTPGAVMLTGNGGDSVLGASSGMLPTHLADPLFRANPLGSLRALARWRSASEEKRSALYWGVRALAEPTVRQLRGQRVRREESVRLPPWLNSHYVHRQRLHARSRRRWAPAAATPGLQMVWDDIWACSAVVDPPGARAFPLRHPLLYRPLVEFMCGIPWEQKLRPRCDRFLQRRALKGVLPELVRRRAGKACGTTALAEGLRRSEQWRDFLCEKPMLAERGMAQAEDWRRAVQLASVGQTQGDKHFVAGVALETWLKQLAGHAGSPPGGGLAWQRMASR